MKMINLFGVLLLAVGTVIANAQDVKLQNQDFSKGFAGWEIKKDLEILESSEDFEILKLNSGNVLKMVGEPSEKPVWRAIKQSVDVKSGDILEFTAKGRLENPQNGYGMFLLTEFYDGTGIKIGYVGGDTSGNIGGLWTTQNCASVVPEGAKTASLELVIHGEGFAYFKDIEVSVTGTAIPQALSANVKVSVDDEVTCDSLWGFGFEDDGWFYNELNRKQGITEAGYKLNEARLEWLDPNWVRMFFWHKEWCPSSDGETFTFESDGMQSHYKTLALYQRLDVPVVFAGTRWGQPTLYDDPDAFAKSVGALFDYLHNEKGLTCVKYWTLVNEPNLDFYKPGYKSFSEYVELHKRVKAEFERLGLDIKMVGSDDASSQIWFDRCVFDQDYYDLVDVLCSHTYFRPDHAKLSGIWHKGRMDSIAMQSVRKPFIVGEYGFTAVEVDSHCSPLMDTYDYAINNADYCINLLNAGGSGAAIWTGHSCYYGDTPKLMDFGLWRYKDNDWVIRPVYHSVAMFSRLIEAGASAYKTSTSHPWRFKAAKAGDTLFWVNLSDEATPVQFSGFEGRRAVVMTENNLKGERDCGDVVEIKGNRFTAPPRSFGYMKEPSQN